jgi:hypothetical protein
MIHRGVNGEMMIVVKRQKLKTRVPSEENGGTRF